MSFLRKRIQFHVFEDLAPAMEQSTSLHLFCILVLCVSINVWLKKPFNNLDLYCSHNFKVYDHYCLTFLLYITSLCWILSVLKSSIEVSISLICQSCKGTSVRFSKVDHQVTKAIPMNKDTYIFLRLIDSTKVSLVPFDNSYFTLVRECLTSPAFLGTWWLTFERQNIIWQILYYVALFLSFSEYFTFYL